MNNRAVEKLLLENRTLRENAARVAGELVRLHSYEPCDPCKSDDHGNCTGDCPSMCCALAEAETAVDALRLLDLSPDSAAVDMAAFDELTRSFDADLEARLLKGDGAKNSPPAWPVERFRNAHRRPAADFGDAIDKGVAEGIRQASGAAVNVDGGAEIADEQELVQQMRKRFLDEAKRLATCDHDWRIHATHYSFCSLICADCRALTTSLVYDPTDLRNLPKWDGRLTNEAS